MDDANQQNSRVIGNEVVIKFGSIGQTDVRGKVDTGATTSSLHAVNIRVNQQQNTISFVCDKLSNNVITMALSGAQEVHSADGGGQSRPIVKFDIEIDGVSIPDAAFNLNDRSNMDDAVLIGQNILQAGNFVIDVNKNTTKEIVRESDLVDNTQELLEAIKIIVKHNVSLKDVALMVHNINEIKD